MNSLTRAVLLHLLHEPGIRDTCLGWHEVESDPRKRACDFAKSCTRIS
jgi:hypothetical protein